MTNYEFVMHLGLDQYDVIAIAFLLAVLIYFTWSESQVFWVILAVLAVVLGQMTAAVVFALLAVATMPCRN